MALKQKKLWALALGSLGVVFGDIGTSPIYALKVVLGLSHNKDILVPSTVYGIISLLIWTVILIVCIKYLAFVMRANNKGEGGIMALVALINSSKLARRGLLIFLGLVGVGLFYGDSVLTPAISVLSAVEGLNVVAPELNHLVVPLTLIILIGLFALQRYGTNTIGRLFGPVMLVWFFTIGIAGAWHVFANPDILQALFPSSALIFISEHPIAAFLSMGAVVLAVTGAEALYADMGHFGRRPIARAWFLLVFPALALCYLGQGALVLQDPGALQNPFYLLFPEYLRVPVIFLATFATLIASQAVISGAFSLTRQAIQLNLLPRMQIKQTSAKYIGQIYIPFVNFLLFITVTLLVIYFGTSVKLAGAYGVAVSGTLLIDSILFMAVTYHFWHRAKSFLWSYGLVFITLETILVLANIPKLAHGGWLPIALAAGIVGCMLTWRTGQKYTARERHSIEKPLREYIIDVQSHSKNLVRLPGQAIYIGHHEGLTPTALRSAIEELHELHEKVVIVYVETSANAHVPHNERAKFDELGYADGISQVTLTYGFHDSPNLPKSLSEIRELSPELDFDPNEAVYFISLSRIVASKKHKMMSWQKKLYEIMSRNALSASDYYKLPVDNTIEMRTLIKI